MRLLAEPLHLIKGRNVSFFALKLFGGFFVGCCFLFFGFCFFLVEKNIHKLVEEIILFCCKCALKFITSSNQFPSKRPKVLPDTDSIFHINRF